MKTLLTAFAIFFGLVAGGNAMACGGGASGKLARVTVKTTYRSPVSGAKKAGAYAMNKVLKTGGGADEVSALGAHNLNAQLVKSTKTQKTYNITTRQVRSFGDISGRATVVMNLIGKKWEATVKSGKFSADW